MRSLVAIMLLIAWLPAVGAEAPSACSGSAFLRSNYVWFGIPVMRNARQSAGDDERCLYVVPVSVEVAEEWHSKRLTEAGWSATKRDPTERGVTLEFRSPARVVRVEIRNIEFGTAILLRRPVIASIAPLD